MHCNHSKWHKQFNQTSAVCVLDFDCGTLTACRVVRGTTPEAIGGDVRVRTPQIAQAVIIEAARHNSLSRKGTMDEEQFKVLSELNKLVSEIGLRKTARKIDISHTTLDGQIKRFRKELKARAQAEACCALDNEELAAEESDKQLSNGKKSIGIGVGLDDHDPSLSPFTSEEWERIVAEVNTNQPPHKRSW